MSVGLAESDNPATDYQRITELLRSAIVLGHLRSGTRLKLRDLAGRYGVSPVPVREALQALRSEGLVVLEPHRGATVRAIDAKVLSDTYGVIEALETHLAGLFAATASPHLIALLEELQAQHAAAHDEGDMQGLHAANARFHLLVNGAGRNEAALEVLGRAQRLTGAVRLSLGHSDTRLRMSIREHEQLVAAFRVQDAPEAARLAGLHVRSARDDLLDRFRPVAARDEPSGRPPLRLRDSGLKPGPQAGNVG